MSQPLINTAAIFGCDDILVFRRTWQNFVYAFLIMIGAMSAIVACSVCFVVGKFPARKREPESGCGAPDEDNIAVTSGSSTESIVDPGPQPIHRRATLSEFWRSFNRLGQPVLLPQPGAATIELNVRVTSQALPINSQRDIRPVGEILPLEESDLP